MRFDITRLPVGEAMIGFVLVALFVTFALAFTVPEGKLDGAAVETPAETPTDGETPQPTGELFEIAMVSPLSFDTEELALPAGTAVTVRADNQETGVLHNWAMYQDQSAAESGEDPLTATEICAAPCVEEVSFATPDAGEYFFRCDLHPTQMVGTVTVE